MPLVARQSGEHHPALFCVADNGHRGNFEIQRMRMKIMEHTYDGHELIVPLQHFTHGISSLLKSKDMQIGFIN